MQICEHLGMQARNDARAVIDRVLLERHRWTAIRAEVQRAFNARLKEHSLAQRLEGRRQPRGSPAG